MAQTLEELQSILTEQTAEIDGLKIDSQAQLVQTGQLIQATDSLIVKIDALLAAAGDPKDYTPEIASVAAGLIEIKALRAAFVGDDAAVQAAIDKAATKSA